MSLAVLCVSDEGASDVDQHAQDLTRRVLGAGHAIVATATVRDIDAEILQQVQAWIDDGTVDAILAIDRSIFSYGDRPPSICLSHGQQDAPTYSLVVKDGVYGFVGVIDIKAARSALAHYQIVEEVSHDNET